MIKKNPLLTGIMFCLCLTQVYAQQTPEYHLYLTGSIGEKLPVEKDQYFSRLQEFLAQPLPSGILFLGDNIHYKERSARHQNLDIILDILKNYNGDIYFIPGNQEWMNGKRGGEEEVRRVERLIQKTLDIGDVFVPDDGCPGPEKKELGRDITLLAINSQWMLNDVYFPDANSEDCKNRDVSEIVNELIDHLDDARNETVLIAQHHPLHSYGRYGGHYPLVDHLFPLRTIGPGLFIPLPILGSIYPFYRSIFGTNQDLVHPSYMAMKKRITEALQFRRNVIYLSGHEFNFQYIRKEEIHFINIGSSVTSKGLVNNDDIVYAQTDRSLAKLEFFEGGRVDLIIYAFEANEFVEQFRSTIIEKRKNFGDTSVQRAIHNEPLVSKASSKYEKGAFHTFLFGHLHRDIWSTEVQHKPLDLSRERGGFRPLRIGGGKTTKSLHLRDTTGKRYVLRSVDKRTYRIIPEIYRNSIVEDIIQDQVIGASHPYAAVVVPHLAEAAGVYHTNPEIFFVPQQGTLGDYNEDLGDQLYLLEEHPGGDFHSASFFGQSRKIVSFNKMLENIETSPGHHIHQEQVLRSRLFDFFIGDWDRHDDQWRWASFKEPSHLGGGKWLTYYEPIPRDRDQVFFDYQGMISSVVKLVLPELRIWQSFKDDIENMKYFNFSGKHFDRRYLTELEKKDWIRLSNDISHCFTDELIEESVKNLPKEIYDLSGEELSDKLKSRRNNIPKWAEEYYDYLAKYVDVAGSKYQDLFQADRSIDGQLELKVYQFQKSGKLRDLIYQRKFYHDETKEVRLYGLSGDDIFQITGTSDKGPLIRIIGGEGDDQLDDRSEINGNRRSTVIYDYLKDAGMKPGNDSRDKRSNRYIDNVYDRHEFYYDKNLGLPFMGFSRDEGLMLRYRHSIATYGFRKYPFGAKHDFGLGYSFNKKQLKFDYTGTFTDVLGKTDVQFSSYLHLPNRVTNFFGLTNEQLFNVRDFDDINFFQYDQFDVLIHPKLQWADPNRNYVFSLGAHYQYLNLGENSGKFIAQLDDSGLTPEDFESSHILGLTAGFQLSKVDNITYPTKGIHFNMNVSVNEDIGLTRSFSKFYGSLVIYNFLWLPESLVLAHKLEGGTVAGSFNFNQGNFIGQNNGLRGFRNERFGGRSSLVFSNDLRWKAGVIKNESIPLTFGFIASYDIGRVWNTNEMSTTWHKSFGGGFFINPLDVLPISVYYLRSTENTDNILIKLGMAF